MNPELAARLADLRSRIAAVPSAVTAYSGGVDSALVMAVAHEVLGASALACIGVSPSLAAREERAAVALAARLGARLRRVHPDELRDPRYAANAGDRCYHCKSALYARLAGLVRDEGFAALFDGTHLGDLAGDDRPGIAAARQNGVRFPLVEAGFTKADVRAVAQALGLPVWNKPAMACTASRVPTGDPISAELLARIEAAEDVLFDLGFADMRVRCERDTARIEVPPDRLADVVRRRDAIVSPLRALGFRHVTLDLAGLRGGQLLVVSPDRPRSRPEGAS
jgi:uncharacterized protein